MVAGAQSVYCLFCQLSRYCRRLVVFLVSGELFISAFMLSVAGAWKKAMASRKRKQSEVDDDSRGRKKRLRVNGDVGSDEEDVLSERDDDDDAVVRRLSLSPLFTTSQMSQTQREAGINEEVRVINFMSHSKLNFQYVVHIPRLL